jgi:hypothetical protein
MVLHCQDRWVILQSDFNQEDGIMKTLGVALCLIFFTWGMYGLAQDYTIPPDMESKIRVTVRNKIIPLPNGKIMEYDEVELSYMGSNFSVEEIYEFRKSMLDGLMRARRESKEASNKT